MANEYQKFGTLEFRPSQRIDGHCDKFDMAGSDAHAFGPGANKDDDTGNVFEGLGLPSPGLHRCSCQLQPQSGGSRTDNDLLHRREFAARTSNREHLCYVRKTYGMRLLSR